MGLLSKNHSETLRGHVSTRDTAESITLTRNQFDVLSLLASAPEPMLAKDIALAIGGLRMSSTYFSLTTLQGKGLVQAEWNVSGRHPVRVFTVTTTGKRALKNALHQALTYNRQTSPGRG